eukprot:CAMPEP_0202468186 /NCGR_PEP_ID=MMETSP1360-20130828/74526_1 /ASSEMBLY_ACC=CAM_ASM_000848 /TAXON_ID=515479 /ORGANISM="Licmophora paradoxa, Strain CCMP2313" /LENGTH=59 /DNA_ID=CAMNT_0049093027 /DNA_START=507 /DNA_END=686 /DNA_ORIENTATION=+
MEKGSSNWIASSSIPKKKKDSIMVAGIMAHLFQNPAKASQRVKGIKKSHSSRNLAACRV